METDTLLSEVAGRLNEKRASIEDQKEYNSVIPLPQDNSPMELEDYENREDKANDEIFQSTIPSLNKEEPNLVYRTSDLKGEKIKSSNGLKDLDNSDKINQKAQRELSAPLAINLIPYSDNNSRPGYFELIERRLKEGEVIGIGRLSSKNPSADPNFINLKAKVVSRTHAQIFLRDGKVFLKDVGSSSGTFLNKNRMSPPNKESVAQPLGDGDIIYFGAEYNDKNDDLTNTKRVSFKFGFFEQNMVAVQKNIADTAKFRLALQTLLSASNPHKMSEIDDKGNECCICIGETGPFQALFIAPCSHCYHYKCVQRLLFQSAMFQCPMCRQVANLSASLSVEDLHEADVNTGNFLSDNAHTRVSDNALSGPASYVMTPASPIIRTTTGRPTSPSIIRPVHSVSSVIGDKATEVKIKDIDPNIEKESKKHGSFGSKIGSFFKSKDSINKSKDSLNNKK